MLGGLNFLASSAASDYSSRWCRELRRPAWLTFERFIPLIWPSIYICSTLSAILTERKVTEPRLRRVVFSLFALNAAFSFAYGIIFTRPHDLFAAAIFCHMIAETIFGVVVVQWRYSCIAAVLNLPYLIWSSFASFLTRDLFMMNREKVTPQMRHVVR